MGLNRQKGSLGKKELKEVEELLMSAGCWFQSKPKGVANSSHAPWTEEATLAVQKAVQTGNQLIEKLLNKVKAVGKTSTSGMLKESVAQSKECVAQLQEFIAKLQMLSLEKTMDEGKEVMGSYVKKTKEAMQTEKGRGAGNNAREGMGASHIQGASKQSVCQTLNPYVNVPFLCSSL